MLHPFEMFGGTYILTEWRAFGSAFLFCEFTPLYGLNRWINNVSDRYIVTWLNGTSANGVYSVSYKIPSILSVFHGIFMQAWILSAVQEYHSDENASFFKTVYNSYASLLTILCSLLIVFSKPIAYLLFRKDFFEAWQYAPFLLIAVIFGALSGVLGGIFSAEKDSKMFALSTCIGAVINIILTAVLVFFIGPIGAAFATMFSSYIVWLFRLIQTRKYLFIDLRLIRDHCSYIILIIQSVLLLLVDSPSVYYLISLFLFVIILFAYKPEISILRNKVTLLTRRNS